MKTEHTKGNWSYVPSTNIYHPVVIIGGRKLIINAFKNHEEQDANAQLIAAAPDMLEALESVMRIRDLWGVPTDPHFKGEEAYEGELQVLAAMEIKIKEAINKAKGNQQ